MASKLTPKQERFCQVYIETGNASEAYRQAYNSENMKPESINRKAKELIDNVKIAARTKKLLDSQLNRHYVTVDSITGEQEEARQLAMVTKQASAAAQASMNKAKLHGLVTDKSKVELDDNRDTDTIRQVEELMAPDKPSVTKH